MVAILSWYPIVYVHNQIKEGGTQPIARMQTIERRHINTLKYIISACIEILNTTDNDNMMSVMATIVKDYSTLLDLCLDPNSNIAVTTQIYHCILGALSMFTWIHFDNMSPTLIEHLRLAVDHIYDSYCMEGECRDTICVDLQEIVSRYPGAFEQEYDFKARAAYINRLQTMSPTMIHYLIEYWKNAKIGKAAYQIVFDILRSKSAKCCELHESMSPNTIDETPITCFT